MLVKMQLSLPAEARYVGMMRNVASCVMADIGVPAPDSDDIQLAVTEACANAVRHADVGEYLVRLESVTRGARWRSLTAAPASSRRRTQPLRSWTWRAAGACG